MNPANRLVTRSILAAELRTGGLDAGSTVLVHASLSSLGYVCGGAQTVVLALLDAVGPDGTIAMPAHSATLSEPSKWSNPPVPEAWWDEIRRSMPAFDPATTPTVRMGAVAETFRSFPGVLRSAHPSGSFAAAGRHAESVTSGHALDVAFGETSPLARLFDLDAFVLLLGVGHEANTSLHLAEVRSGAVAETDEGAPVMENDTRVWRTYRDVAYDADDFPAIGEAFAATGGVRETRVGAARTSVFRQRAIVDFAVDWIRAGRRDARTKRRSSPSSPRRRVT